MWRTFGFCLDFSITVHSPKVEKGPTCLWLEFHGVTVGWAGSGITEFEFLNCQLDVW